MQNEKSSNSSEEMEEDEIISSDSENSVLEEQSPIMNESIKVEIKYFII